MKELRGTEIKLEVSEQARCTCGWCGEKCESNIKVDSNGRLGTTGHASKTAAWEGAKHLYENRTDGQRSNPNDLKKQLVQKRTSTLNAHTVTIRPSIEKASAMVK